MVFLANSDLLAMVLVLWTMLPTTSEWLTQLLLMEYLPALRIVVIRRASLPLTPAAQFLLHLLRRSTPRTNISAAGSQTSNSRN